MSEDAQGAALGAESRARLDPGDMLGAIAGLPAQLASGYEAARAALAGATLGPGAGPGPGGVVVCGMGGSAIGADLAFAALPQLPVPAAVVRGYQLPAWVGPRTLVIAASYSGDTEETLTCAGAALERGCRPVCISSGGRLAALAAGRGLTLITVPGGGQPRAALGHLTAPLLAVLEAAGLVEDLSPDVAEAVALLERGNAEHHPDATEDVAKALARTLHGRLAVVYGAGATAPVARRWKGQINENAKAPAFFDELPELDHNELMGWTSLPRLSAVSVAVTLEDERGDPRLARRAAETALLMERRGVTVVRAQARGTSLLARLFSLVQLGDYASYYLALLYGVDPTPVAAIQDLKARLAAAEG